MMMMMIDTFQSKDSTILRMRGGHIENVLFMLTLDGVKESLDIAFKNIEVYIYYIINCV